MDAEVEATVRACHTCQLQSNRPAPAPLHPWKWPDNPWHRVHMDYAGPMEGKMFLVIIDAHSKWMEVLPVASANATNTVEALRTVFATHGTPVQIVSDNGTPFVNEQFAAFTSLNHIQHIRVAPYHPASNGLAERAVQTFKRSFSTYKQGSVNTRLARFLLTYRRLPQTTTGTSPAEMLMGRRLHCRLDAIYPDKRAEVEPKQESMKDIHDQRAKQRTLFVGDPVYVYTPNKEWLEATVSTQTGPLSYSVVLADGRLLKRHVDHLRRRYDIPEVPRTDGSEASMHVPDSPDTVTAGAAATDEVGAPAAAEDQTTPESTNSASEPNSPPTPAVRRSSRARKPPLRFGCD